MRGKVKTRVLPVPKTRLPPGLGHEPFIGLSPTQRPIVWSPGPHIEGGEGDPWYDRCLRGGEGVFPVTSSCVTPHLQCSCSSST
jgi:hypothetical protein